MGGTDSVGNWVLFWWQGGRVGGGMLSKSLIWFSIGVLDCVPSLFFTWGQTMVKVMKTMGASFKSSHVCTATLSAPNPAAGHWQPTPLPETPGHSWASLGQSLMGSLLLSPGSWCAQVSICALQESVSPVLCKFWQLYGWLVATSSKRAYAIHKSAAGRAPAPVADLYLLRRHQNTVLSQSLWGPWALVCTKRVWALWVSLVGVGFDSRHDFVPPTIFLGLLLCPWMWDISSKLLQCHAASTPTLVQLTHRYLIYILSTLMYKNIYKNIIV